MRLITTLSLSTTALLCAVLPLAAQNLRSAADEPAVRALPTALVTTAAPAPAAQVAPTSTDLPPTTDAPASDTASSATVSAPSARSAPAAPASSVVLSSATVPPPSASSVPSSSVPAVATPSATNQVATATSAPAAPPAATSPTPVTPASAPADADITDSLNRNSIVAVVNDTPISEYDLLQRVQLNLALDPDPSKLTAADLKRLRDDTLQQLEDEQVERDAAVKKHLTVSPVDINKTIDSMLAQNKMNRATLDQALAAKGSSEASLKNKYIAAEVWQKVVQEEYSDDVNASITPAEIDYEVHRAAEGANKTHYEVLEIFMPSSGPEQDAKVFQTVQGIITQLHNGTSFADVAREYSRNPSAAAGGDIGWVYDGQLEQPLNDALSKMKRGDLSTPIKGTGGYYLLGLRDRQEPLGTNVSVEEPVTPSGPPGTLPLAHLQLPTVGANQEQIENVMKIALQIQQNIGTCADLEKIQKQLPHSVYEDMGNYKLADLNPDIQKALAATKSGEVAQPVTSAIGIEVFMRCDKRAGPPRTAFAMPTLEQVQVGLFQDRMAVLARRYLSELRRDANIQERDATSGKIVDAALATVH